MAYSQKKRAKEKLLCPSYKRNVQRKNTLVFSQKKNYHNPLIKETCKEKLFLLEKDLEIHINFRDH